MALKTRFSDVKIGYLSLQMTENVLKKNIVVTANCQNTIYLSLLARLSLIEGEPHVHGICLCLLKHRCCLQAHLLTLQNWLLNSFVMVSFFAFEFEFFWLWFRGLKPSDWAQLKGA